MPRTAMRFDAPPSPWAIDAPLTAAPISLKVLSYVRWADATVELKPRKRYVLDYVTLNPPDLTVEQPTVIFCIKGNPGLFSTTADNSNDTSMDSLTSGALWGIIGWLDVGNVEPWQQF